MKPRSFLIPVLLVALIGMTIAAESCRKTSSGTPTISLESISTPVQVNDSMRAHFKFTGGGKISNGFFWFIRTRLNQLPATNPSGADTFDFQLPSFSANSGELSFSLPWNGYLNETNTQNDTLVFKFFVQTADSTLTTDTVTSPKIIVLYQ
ncbi:MAG TPA: hypothetical protein VN616_17850 [Puia sp.]|nr:hypothetical protein [Puia sp.]